MLLNDEIPQQSQRFNNPGSIDKWKESCQQIDEFLAKRENQFLLQTRDFFLLSNDSVTAITCYPNPALSGETLNMMVKSELDNITKVDVYDLNGQFVYSEIIFLKKGENRLQLNLGNRKGIHIIKVGKKSCKVALL
jgi:hypothetical protein